MITALGLIMASAPASADTASQLGLQSNTENITNKTVIDHVKLFGIKSTVHELQRISKCDGRPNLSISQTSIEPNVKALLKKHSTLLKSSARASGQQKLSNFLERTYKFAGKKEETVNGPSVSKKRKIDGGVILHEQVECYKLTSESLASELAECQKQVENLKSLNLNLKKRVKSCEVQNSKLRTLVKEKSKQRKASVEKVRYYMKRVAKLEKELQEQVAAEPDNCWVPDKLLADQDDNHQHEAGRLQELEVELDLLHEKMAESCELIVYSNGVYTPSFQKCVYNLLECNVSSTQVSRVLETVLNLVGKRANKLPSRSTINNMNIQRLALSQTQIATDFSLKQNTTLLTDETSKYGEKYGVYAATDETGTPYVLGLRSLVTKSAQDTLQVFQDILSDVNERCDATKDDVSQKILANIVATMSDRAATEYKFNELLESYRLTVLPAVIENYDSLSEADKLVQDRLLNFFCSLHLLVHFAESCGKALLEVEQANFGDSCPTNDKSFSKPGESGTLRLVRTTCKLFSRGGDEKSGCFGTFKNYVSDFLKENKMMSLPLTPYRGNRFNIVFTNASCIYFLHEHMVTFLENSGSNINRLAKAVLNDLKQEFYVAGCKALGLVNKLITTPFWNLIESKNVTIFDLNDKYIELLQFFDNASQNLEKFMNGEILPFGSSTEVKKDKIYECLVNERHDLDDKVETILAIMLPTMAKLCKHALADQLPGGKYASFTDVMKEKTKGSPKHNKFSETLFAYADQILRFKPNVKVLSTEAYVMYTHNKTGEWLTGKSEKEQEALLITARKQVPKLRQQFKLRQKKLFETRQALIFEKMKKTEESKTRKLRSLENMTNDIVFYGLWQSEEQIDSELATYNSDAQKVKALKAQLKFRQNVLKQDTGNRNVFLFSKDKVSLKWGELAFNLKSLVKHAENDLTPKERSLLIGQKVRHKFVKEGNGQEQWHLGRVISQVSATRGFS